MKKAWLLLLLPALFVACSKEEEEISTYHVVKSDYIEKITVNGNIQAVNTTFLKAPNMFMSTITWMANDGAYVHKGDTVCILEHAETILQLEATIENLKKAEAQLEKTEADHEVKLALLEAEIENNNIQLSINSLDSLQKTFAPPQQKRLLSLNQQKAQIQKEKLDKKYRAQKLIGESEIRGLKSRIKQMENQIDRIQLDLNQLFLIAPIDGMIMREEAPELFFSSSRGYGLIGGKMAVGSTTWSNMNVLQIPDIDSVEVIVKLLENEYKRVEEGQQVNILVEARDNLQTSGKIKRKMLTGQQMNRDSQVKTYEALVLVDSCHLSMTPGLNAICEITLNQYKDTLVVPAIAVFDQADVKFVYLREGRKFRKTTVTTGPSNSTFCVIIAGLADDSFIAMSKPPSGKIIRDKEDIPASTDQPGDSLERLHTEIDTAKMPQ